MLQRVVLVANAIVSGLFGLGFLFAANSVLGLYGGMQMEPATDQLFGAALIGLALVNFFARDVAAPQARRAIFLGNLAYNAVAVAVIGPGIASGTNTIGWVTVGLAAITALAFAYLLYTAVRGAEPVPAIAG